MRLAQEVIGWELQWQVVFARWALVAIQSQEGQNHSLCWLALVLGKGAEGKVKQWQGEGWKRLSVVGLRQELQEAQVWLQ